MSAVFLSLSDLTIFSFYLNLNVPKAIKLKLPLINAHWCCIYFLLAGNPSPTLMSGEKRISLQCLHNYMLLDMDLQDIPGLEPASLHLRHFSCKPYQVLDTRAIFRVPFQGCGTTRESNSDYIVYENVVDNSKESNATRVLIRHAQELRYPFSCRYRQKYFLILQEGQSGKRRENEIDRGNGNSTKEKGKCYYKLNSCFILN